MMMTYAICALYYFCVIRYYVRPSNFKIINEKNKNKLETFLSISGK